MKSLSELPSLGVGLGYRPAFGRELLADPEAVDFLEITVEHYLEAPPEKIQELDRLQQRFTLIPHALNLSLGSAEGLNSQYLALLSDFIVRLNPPWWSEHIAFTRAGGIEIGHLTPLPFSEAALEVLCRNIAEVQKVIPQPLILENITYMLHLGGEFSEAEFLSELLKRTGCGLLLDITNLYINSVNHGYDIEAFLAALPLEKVVQLHFVGEQALAGRLVDSHARPTSEAIWQMMETVLARTKVKGMILERDEHIPPLAELKSELAKARTLQQKYCGWV